MRRGQRVQRKHKDTKKEKTSSSWGRRSTGTKTKTNKNISLSWRGINGYKDKATKKEKISTSWGGAGGQRVPWGSRLISTNFLLPPWIMLRQLLVIIIIICIIIALYGGSETTVSFVESPFFGVIKFKLNITTWLVHFGRAWKRLNINGLHFIICQVILRGVWCRKWEGFAKFFLWMSRAAECVFLAQNEAGGLLQSDEIQSESVYISWQWKIFKDCSKNIRRIFSQRVNISCQWRIFKEWSETSKRSKQLENWQILELSTFKPCTWRKDHNPTKPPFIKHFAFSISTEYIQQ